ncbi:MAG TPA: hypothetical protein VFZ65_06345 [Planctomycetota bacterium]|nr:hypothetical protein [Planctomycetota bacterium]
MQQRSLFPDGFEVQEQAFAALRELDVPAALALVRRARRIDARLVDLDGLEEALVWLQQRLVAAAEPELLAAVLRAVPEDAAATRLSAVAAMFVDQAIARWLSARVPRSAAFLDRERRVPSALVDLLLGNAPAARVSLLAAVDAGHAEHAGVLGCLGDACLIDQRPDEANACYVRCLLLDPFALDTWRLRHAGLRACALELASRCGVEAPMHLLATAWLEGHLHVPTRNAWLPPARLVNLLTEAEGSSPGARLRQFGLLLYQDRTLADRPIDVARREQMAALWPDGFRRFMAKCRAVEQRSATS